ncbi:MAG: BLUF domain-containing protein [Pseudomonadota bacterium]
MIELIYYSRAIKPLTNNDVSIILEGAQEKNRERHLSGMLMFCNDIFLQLLEGERREVNHLFQSISHDARHFDIQIISVREIQMRSFSVWSMAYLGAKEEKEIEINGRKVIFSPDDLNRESAYTLLQNQFKKIQLHPQEVL